ncbi:MAG: MotA/TolQ/ExbB proton channel family protein [Proteobacteria bacterium]|nr:MotA/TolQ/ExbB proton channel family protein [Pseudomonadota bacterium]
MADPTTVKAGATNVTEAVPVGVFEQALLFMEDGGPVMYLLLAISILTLTLIIGKLIQFWMLRVNARGFVEPALRSWHEGRNREAMNILRPQRNPVARVLEVALYGSTDGEGRQELVKEEITRVAGLELDNLRSGLRPLALIANISPLIGLLGTVLGMINAFKALQAAGNKVDPSILSGGIWVALLTTAAGLVIAIPAAAAHNWMEGVVYRAQRAMEDAVTRVFTVQLSPARGGDQPAEPGAEAAQPAE